MYNVFLPKAAEFYHLRDHISVVHCYTYSQCLAQYFALKRNFLKEAVCMYAHT